jgi:hypothetical protein
MHHAQTKYCKLEANCIFPVQLRRSSLLSPLLCDNSQLRCLFPSMNMRCEATPPTTRQRPSQDESPSRLPTCNPGPIATAHLLLRAPEPIDHELSSAVTPGGRFYRSTAADQLHAYRDDEPGFWICTPHTTALICAELLENSSLVAQVITHSLHGRRGWASPRHSLFRGCLSSSEAHLLGGSMYNCSFRPC